MIATPRRLLWTMRPEPLQAAAVVAEGPVVAELASATVDRLTADATLRVVHAPGWLLVLGAADDLPWADGAVYLGHDHGLLVPTTVEPFPGPAFLAASLRSAPLRVVLPGRLLTAALPARPPDPAQLTDLA